ncbi:MAG: hypothetical protein WCF10_04390 [Polyangiales bacterium]
MALILNWNGVDIPLGTLRSGIAVRSWPIPPLRIYHQSRRPLGANRKQVGSAFGTAVSA